VRRLDAALASGTKKPRRRRAAALTIAASTPPCHSFPSGSLSIRDPAGLLAGCGTDRRVCQRGKVEYERPGKSSDAVGRPLYRVCQRGGAKGDDATGHGLPATRNSPGQVSGAVAVPARCAAAGFSEPVVGGILAGRQPQATNGAREGECSSMREAKREREPVRRALAGQGWLEHEGRGLPPRISRGKVTWITHRLRRLTAWLIPV
jgi:hypothetical protein